MVAFDAVVLAGGRGSRLGGVAKAQLAVGGRRLVDRVVAAAAAAGARRVIVAGPAETATPRLERAGLDLRVVADDPPFGGPLAGLAAALPETDAPLLAVLAGDLPFVAGAIGPLLAAATAHPEADGAVLHDVDRAQWLCGVYRRAALAAGLEALGDVRDRPVRALLEPLALIAVPAPAGAALDVDTWPDLARASDLATRIPEPVEGDPNVSDPSPAPLPPEALDDWGAALTSALGLDPADVPVGEVLDLARDAAHGVARPAAPLTAFAVGLAAGRSGDADSALRRARELAAAWRER
ncbi:NTP transferase domain-containing protein [Agromyces sp. G08B096]|uniref:NTP transferase domain-containing protein n=1 Tax=Agromyces sp. G08B096 TaxID=3156399 RepID=A0AAU7W4R9_9MICO